VLVIEIINEIASGHKIVSHIKKIFVYFANLKQRSLIPDTTYI